MSTTEPPGDMTAEDHIREARRYAAAAEDLAGATSYEWISRRTNDLQAAQVHASLAQTLKAAELLPVMARIAAWIVEPEAPVTPVAPASGDDPGAGPVSTPDPSPGSREGGEAEHGGHDVWGIDFGQVGWHQPEPAPPVAAALDADSPLPGMPSPSPVTAGDTARIVPAIPVTDDTAQDLPAALANAQARAEAAEARLAAISDACRSIPTPIAERILAIIGSEEEAAVDDATLERYARMIHAARESVNAERERPFVLEPWERRTAEQREQDMRAASAIAAAVLADREAGHDCAGEARRAVAAERERIRQLAIRSHAVCAGEGGGSIYFAALIGEPEERSDEKEADRG